ncbi:hypothetical protein VB796_08125 [Arcicella sp. LKC2W]|nr:hypothetical protein [Arcicella sp. LKC2W]MEA5458999.1 hypothetical protein [Arcicella sp. LKC2W]
MSNNLRMLADVFKGQPSGKTLRGGKFCTLLCVGGRKTDVAERSIPNPY